MVVSEQSREELIGRLPEALGIALRLHEEGRSDEVVAEALDIPVQGVSVVLRLARAKLDRLTVASR